MAPLRHDEDGSETRVTTEERFERIEHGTQRQLDSLGIDSGGRRTRSRIPRALPRNRSAFPRYGRAHLGAGFGYGRVHAGPEDRCLAQCQICAACERAS